MKQKYNRKLKSLGGAAPTNNTGANAAAPVNNAGPGNNAAVPANATGPTNATGPVNTNVPANSAGPGNAAGLGNAAGPGNAAGLGNAAGPGNNTGNTPPAGNVGNAGNANTGKNNTGVLNMNKISKGVNNIGTRVRSSVGKMSNFINNKREKSKAAVGKIEFDSLNKYLMILFIAIIFILLIIFTKYLVVMYSSYSDNNPFLIEGTKSAKHSVVINQDPESINYIQIRRSENEDGMEFTYSFWMLIMDISYKRGEWKHVFHKGNNTSYPNRAPGVWINQTKNSLRIYMNTFDNILEYVDVDDIPIKKWFCIQVMIQNVHSHNDNSKDLIAKDNSHVLDIYLNGQLKKSKLLESVPKQNNGDLWVNLFGGYDGYLSKLRYYASALDEDRIEEIVREGPASVVTTDTGEMPPYLEDKWWYNK